MLKWLKYIIAAIVFFLFFVPGTARAENKAYSKNGNIIFETTDTIATTGVRWTEVGFTVRRDRSGGNPVKDKAYGTLMLKESYRSKKNNGDGTYQVTFTIPKKDVEKELSKAGILSGKGDFIYLNGIFKVIRYGKADKGYYRTLAGIKGAASWRNKKDFDELFDVEIAFHDPAPTVTIPEKEKTKKEGIGEAAPFAVLQAEERGKERFDAKTGIPAEEPLYCNGWSREYLRSYEYKNMQGEKSYPVTVSKTYHLSWTEYRTYIDEKTGEEKERAVSRRRSQTVSQTISVKRQYAYWQIEDLYVGIPKQMTVYNKALPGEKVVMDAAGYVPPSVDYERYLSESGHIKEPSYPKTLTLPASSVYGGSSPPSVPSENFQSYAEAAVPEIKVRNDRLVFEKNVIMTDVWQEKETQSPSELPEAERQTGDNVFYKTGLFLPVSRKNGNYTSIGEVVYRPLVYIKDKNSRERTYSVKGINPVFVHTPAVCNGSVEDKYRECQMLFPDQERGALILGKCFQVQTSAKGHHRSIQGYYYQDYSRYIKNRQVKFPFAVSYKGVRKEKDTWIEVDEQAEFFLPADVTEGKYRVEFRCIAKNGFAGDKEERFANLSEKNYIAKDWVDVEVSGQLKKFSIYDISDYPLWQGVFRKEKSLSLSGFSFQVKDMPLRQGSHPFFENKGVLKPGYTLRMNCLTVGNMEGEKDYIHIKPRFYQISSDFKERQEVDIYYSETIGGTYQQLVKAGSEKDRNNVKVLRLGDVYLSIPKAELKKTAEKKNLALTDFLKKEYRTFTFSNIMLSSRMQMLLEPEGVQKWYFEYYLPSKLYAVPKGFSLEKYQNRNRLTMREDFWIKDGFLILNFDIETLQNGKRHLSYLNTEMSEKGYRNQWRYEKNGANTEPFALGDVALFELNQSAAIDYQSQGTH